MSPQSSYSFFPWIRQGIANNITTPETDMNVKLRASVEVKLNLKSQKLDGGEQIDTITRPVELYGPGDIVGIESRAVIRTEPRHWITNFEPNYMACIEFYDEDFPWRYTPAAPKADPHRLRPWIMLILLKEDEFEDGANIANKPLPFIKLKTDGSTLPRPDQLWAWAHVHVNSSLTASDSEIVSDNMSVVLPPFEAMLKKDADIAYSRILCPRKLEENVSYHAFLVPTYESGRLAGLGQSIPATLPANQHAWEQNVPAGLELPVYYRWYFRTGTAGDFEYLVRLLEAKPVDSRVGTRDMDVQFPGANLQGIIGDGLGGILKLDGSLRVPKVLLNSEELAEREKYENWDNRPLEGINYPRPFQEALAAFINLASNYSQAPAAEAHADAAAKGYEVPTEPNETDDPLITAPLYGRWHALTERLLDSNPATPDRNWVHNLNLDPRYRVAAGFGTYVIQDKQEEYMEAAWAQVGDVLEANRKIRAAQLAREVSYIWYDHHIKPLYAAKPEHAMLLIAPMNRRVVMDGFTVHQHFRESLLPPSLLSGVTRRTLRPHGRLIRKTQFGGAAQSDNLFQRVSSGEIPAVPPKIPPPNLPTGDAIADAMTQSIVPDWIVALLKRFPNLPFLLLILMAVIGLLTLLLAFTGVGLLIGAAILYGLYQFYRRVLEWANLLSATDTIRPEGQTPEAVDKLSQSPDFVLSEPGSSFMPTLGGNDSPEARQFKEALRDSNALVEASLKTGQEPVYKRLDLAAIQGEVITAIDPVRTVPKRALHSIFVPQHVLDGMRFPITQAFEELLAYPKIDVAMYKPLVDISSELFLPNIQLIEQNSITLLETNQKFIEAYMVGINHEFAREILWREYPSTLRGTYFRQFWDITSYLLDIDVNDPQRDEKFKMLRETLYDIPQIHQWPIVSELGKHDNREAQTGTAEEEVVLVIRGELLKKYPTAVIYAHRAKWQTRSATDPTIDKSKERQLDPDFESVGDKPPRDKIKTPLYEAKVEPDIYFFGFDLTAEAAKGETEEKPDDPGWFFVIKERPGETRFGLDVDQEPGQPAPTVYVWNDLSWEHIANSGNFIEINNPISLTDPEPGDVGGSRQEKYKQYKDDIHVNWNSSTNAAELAYIFYQSPVMVAIHASEMLRRK
jgi:hypothetical protein